MQTRRLEFGTTIRDAAIIGGFVQFAVRNDTVAAIWSLSDSVYLFSGDGRRLGSVPFRSRFFRTPAAEPPGRSAAPEEHVEWLASFNYASGVWWVAPRFLAVKYSDLLPRDGPRGRSCEGSLHLHRHDVT